MRATLLSTFLSVIALFSAPVLGQSLSSSPGTSSEAPRPPASATAPAPGTANQTPSTGATSDPPGAVRSTPRRELTVSDVVEKNLIGSEGRVIGEIEKVVESPSDRKKYLVVSSGGFFGLFETQIAVPLDRVEVHNDQLVVREMTEAQLKSLPEFDSDKYHDLGGLQKLTILERR
jgi:sporulation protein YlmC with PRC-barrel domain